MRYKKPASCVDCRYHYEDPNTNLHECTHQDRKLGHSPVYDLRICKEFDNEVKDEKIN